MCIFNNIKTGLSPKVIIHFMSLWTLLCYSILIQRVDIRSMPVEKVGEGSKIAAYTVLVGRFCIQIIHNHCNFALVGVSAPSQSTCNVLERYFDCWILDMLGKVGEGSKIAEYTVLVRCRTFRICCSGTSCDRSYLEQVVILMLRTCQRGS